MGVRREWAYSWKGVEKEENGDFALAGRERCGEKGKRGGEHWLLVLFNSLVEGDDMGIGNNVEIGSDYMNDFVKNFEATEVKTKEKRKQAKGVEKYF